MQPSSCPPWQPEPTGPTRRIPRRPPGSYTTARDTIQEGSTPARPGTVRGGESGHRVNGLRPALRMTVPYGVKHHCIKITGIKMRGCAVWNPIPSPMPPSISPTCHARTRSTAVRFRWGGPRAMRWHRRVSGLSAGSGHGLRRAGATWFAVPCPRVISTGARSAERRNLPARVFRRRNGQISPLRRPFGPAPVEMTRGRRQPRS